MQCYSLLMKCRKQVERSKGLKKFLITGFWIKRPFSEDQKHLQFLSATTPVPITFYLKNWCKEIANMQAYVNSGKFHVFFSRMVIIYNTLITGRYLFKKKKIDIKICMSRSCNILNFRPSSYDVNKTHWQVVWKQALTSNKILSENYEFS